MPDEGEPEELMMPVSVLTECMMVFARLTPVQQHVLCAVLRGERPARVAKALGVSQAAVSHVMDAIAKKEPRFAKLLPRRGRA